MSNNLMSNFTPPPIRQNVANGSLGCSQKSCNGSGGTHHCACRLFLCLLVLIAAGLIVLAGYKHGVNTSSRPEAGNPVYVSKALFCDRDSVMYYYEQGLLHDDPKGLFVLGVAARLRYDGHLPEEIQAFPVQQGDSFLLLSANYGYTPAIQAIYCLHKHNQWVLELPNEK